MTPIEIGSYVAVLLIGVFLGETWTSPWKARSSSLCPTCLGPTDDKGLWSKRWRVAPTDENGTRRESDEEVFA